MSETLKKEDVIHMTPVNTPPYVSLPLTKYTKSDEVKFEKRKSKRYCPKNPKDKSWNSGNDRPQKQKSRRC